MAGVLVLYREGEAERANRLSRHLFNRFGSDLLMRDLDDTDIVRGGRDSVTDLARGVELVVVVIGPHGLADMAKDGCALVSDMLGQGTAILPVLVGGTAMPGDLPARLAALADMDAMNLRDDSWNDDLVRLLERVRDLVRPTRQRDPLYSVQLDVCRLQDRLLAALGQGQNPALDPAEAVDVAGQILDLLNKVVPLYPADIILLSTRGYTHKNLAAALSRLDRGSEMDEHLALADRIFSTMREELPLEPAAWDGKGSVEFVRGNLDEALACFERALKLNPAYEDSVNNREAVLERMERRGVSS